MKTLHRRIDELERRADIANQTVIAYDHGEETIDEAVERYCDEHGVSRDSLGEIVPVVQQLSIEEWTARYTPSGPETTADGQ